MPEQFLCTEATCNEIIRENFSKDESKSDNFIEGENNEDKNNKGGYIRHRLRDLLLVYREDNYTLLATYDYICHILILY